MAYKSNEIMKIEREVFSSNKRDLPTRLPKDAITEFTVKGYGRFKLALYKYIGSGGFSLIGMCYYNRETDHLISNSFSMINRSIHYLNLSNIKKRSPNIRIITDNPDLIYEYINNYYESR